MILIKNGTLVDGSGTPGQRKDILISDNRITAIGNFPHKDAELVIEAAGLLITPGFIDVNTDSDHYLSLFTDPAQQDFLLQGVTTIVGGMCGSSLAPLLYGTLESVRKWADTNQINVNWRTVKEFLNELKNIKIGVNFATLVGHSTIRRAILGEQLRDLTEAELSVMKKLVRNALEDGAFGLSTGLGYNHSHNTPYLEIKALTDIVAEFSGIYATHLRSEREDLGRAVEETIQIASESKVKTLISHFRPLMGLETEYEKALSSIEQEKTGLVQFDLYPFIYSILPAYLLLPAEYRHGNLEHMQEAFSSASHIAEIKKGFGRLSGRGLRIARAPGLDFLVGKTLDQFAKQRNLSLPDALLELMRITKLRAVLFNENVSESAGIKALLSERALLASNSPSLVSGPNLLENERAAKTFKKFIGLMADRKRPIEWTIQKLTQKPAAFFGFKDRGVIKEGMLADLVVLRDREAVHVVLNGKIAVENGKLKNIRAGVILHR